MYLSLLLYVSFLRWPYACLVTAVQYVPSSLTIFLHSDLDNWLHLKAGTVAILEAFLKLTAY